MRGGGGGEQLQVKWVFHYKTAGTHCLLSTTRVDIKMSLQGRRRQLALLKLLKHHLQVGERHCVLVDLLLGGPEADERLVPLLHHSSQLLLQRLHLHAGLLAGGRGPGGKNRQIDFHYFYTFILSGDH